MPRQKKVVPSNFGSKRPIGCSGKAIALLLISIYQRHVYGPFIPIAECWKTNIHPDNRDEVIDEIKLCHADRDHDSTLFYRLRPDKVRQLKRDYPKVFATPIQPGDIR